MEWQGGANVLTSYYAPEVMREGSATRWLHKDHLSSNRLVTDQAGAVTVNGRTAYGPTGKPLSTPSQSKA